MKKIFMVLVICLMTVPSFAVTVWQDDMSSLANWSEASNADPEEGDDVGGIQVIAGERVQMNSWWSGAGWTNMWRGTGLTIQPNANYTVTLNMNNHSGGDDDLTVNLSSIDAGNWTNFGSEAVTPAAGSYADYTVSFTTVGGANVATVGKELGIGCNAGWWHNLSIETITIDEEILAGPQNPTPAHDPNPTDDLNTVGEASATYADKVQVLLSWDPSDDPNVTKYYLFLDTEPNYIDDIPVELAVDPNITYLADNLEFDMAYYWQVRESVQNSGPNDPNTVVGAIWAFETINASPVLFENPQDTLVAEGGDAFFEVVASSTSTPQFDWYLTSTPATPDPLSDTALGTTSDPNITVSSVPLSYAGQFVYCVITNSSPVAITSGTALLEIERLIASWQMDGDLTDSENDWDGTMTNGLTPTYGTDRDSQANKALLLGDDPNHVQITGSEDAFNFFHLGLTINCWVKSEDGWGAYVCKQDREGYDPWNGYVFHQNNNGMPGLNLRGVGGPEATTAVNDNAWHMVTATYDGATGEMAIYVDGERENVITSSATPRMADNVVTIGAEQISGTTSFNGLIDQVEVYTYAKTQHEVLDLYNATEDPDKILCIDPYATNADIWPVGAPDCKVDINDAAELLISWLSCGLYPTCP